MTRLFISLSSCGSKSFAQEVKIPTFKPKAAAVNAAYETVPPRTGPSGVISFVTWPTAKYSIGLPGETGALLDVIDKGYSLSSAESVLRASSMVRFSLRIPGAGDPQKGHKFQASSINFPHW